MPRKQVNGFEGTAVHGGAGEYRYEHPDGTIIHVGPHPEDPGAVNKSDWRWQVAVREGIMDGGEWIIDGVSKETAFQVAYDRMERYEGKKQNPSNPFDFGSYGGGP